MPIAFGNATDLGNNGLSFIAADPPIIGPRAIHTGAHTLGVGSNVLLVAVEGAFPPVDDIISVTYAGYPLIEAAKYVPQIEDDQRCLYLYGLVNPPAGTNDVIAECAGNHYLAVLAMDYSGATDEDISIARNVAPQGSTELTTTINVIRPDSWVALLESGYDEDVAQPGTGVVGPRTYGQQWGSPSFFDSGAGVPAGDYQFTTYRNPPGENYPGILHLAIAFAPALAEPVAVTLEPATHAPVHAAGMLAARVFARPTALALDAAVHPVAPVCSDLPVHVFSGAFPIVALDPATFPPVVARGDLPAQIFGTAAPILALDPAAFPLHLAAELGVRIVARPTGLALDAVAHPLAATGRLAARVYARPLAMHFIAFPQTFDATGRLPVRVNLSSLLSATIEHLRRNVPALGGRIAGAADYVTALQSDNATMQLPAGYVLPLDQEANGNLVMVGLEQIVTRTFGVVVEFAVADRRGQAPAMRYDEIQEQLCRALLLWQPQAAIGGPGTGRVPNHQGFYLAGGRMLDFNRARLFYQWEFALDWQLFSAG